MCMFWMCECVSVYSQIGDSVGMGSSTHVPLSSVRPLGHVQTGPLGLSRHSHSHFFLSQGLVTDRDKEYNVINNDVKYFFPTVFVFLIIATVSNRKVQWYDERFLFCPHFQVACSGGTRLYLWHGSFQLLGFQWVLCQTYWLGRRSCWCRWRHRCSPQRHQYWMGDGVLCRYRKYVSFILHCPPTFNFNWLIKTDR